MTLSGSSSSTDPQDTLWFCHLCNWSGYLAPCTYHQCKPVSADAEDTGLPRPLLPNLLFLLWVMARTPFRLFRRKGSE